MVWARSSAQAGRLQVERDLDVDLERLRGLLLLAVEHAVGPVEQPCRRGRSGRSSRAPPGALFRPRSPSPQGRRPRSTASATRAARTFSTTSWTRTMSAPAATPSTVVATVPSTRWSGGRSSNRPRVDLREVPRRIGRPSARSAPRSASSARLWSGVFPNPNPGSTISPPPTRRRRRGRARAPPGGRRPPPPRRRDSAPRRGCASARSARREPPQAGPSPGRRPRPRCR